MTIDEIIKNIPQDKRGEMKKCKSLLRKLDSRIALIESMAKDDPERHIKAIIHTTGSNFLDDLELLAGRCLELGKIELATEIKK